MKKSILLLCSLLITVVALAQPPQKMSYQTVIRNATDDLVSNTTVGIQISVLQGTSSGTAVYVETHAPMTNANGLASLEIGGGTSLTGTMAAIDWGSGPYFVKSDVDIDGGTNYTLSLVSELLSVPYALHAFSSGDGQWSASGDGINTSNNVVGINSPAPAHTLDVRSLSQADPAGLNVSNADRSRYVRLFSGSETIPDPLLYWAPSQNLLFATYDDNTFDLQEKMRISSTGEVGIGINQPEARLDILGGDWNLDAGNPGDLRIGNATNNFRIGVATGGGGAGVTRLYTNSNALILGVNDTPSLILEQNGEIKAPSMTNALIESGGDKSLITKEYALLAFSSADHWSESGSGINTSSFSVGINSTDPAHTLDVRSQSLADPAGLNVSNADRSRYVRLFSGSESAPDPSVAWAPSQNLLFATYDDNTFDFQEKMRISSTGEVGIGINQPEARLDILGGDWNLDAGNPGDLRIGNATNNFRIGVATGGGGAGVTRLYTNSNALILGVNDTPSLILEQNGEIKAPSMTNALIESGGDKALVTKEYVDANSNANASAIKIRTTVHITDLVASTEQNLILNQTSYNFGGGIYNSVTGEYTVPFSGVYNITSIINTGFGDAPGDPTALILILRVYVNGINTEQITLQAGQEFSVDYGQNFSYINHLSLNANDVLSFRILPYWGGGTPSPRINQFSNISITKVY